MQSLLPLRRRQSSRTSSCRRRAIAERVLPRRSFEALEERTLLSVSWDGGGDGISWHDPINWDTDALPGPSDDVVINVAGDITVTHSSGDDAIRSLVSEEGLLLSGGTLDVTTTVQVNNTFTMNGTGTLVNATVLPGTSGEGVTIASTGVPSLIHTRLDGVTMDADLDVTTFNSAVRIVNGLTLNGTALLSNAGRLLSEATQTWNGAGQLALAGAAPGVVIDGDTTLTIGPDLIVRGNGSLAASNEGPNPFTGVLVNQGLISADEPAATLIVGAEFTNEGIAEARNGGVFHNTGPLDNIGTIRALASSSAGFRSGTSSGTIRAEGGAVSMGVTSATFTLPGNTFELVSGGVVTVEGTLQNTGNTVFLDTADGEFRLIGNGQIVGGTVAGTPGSMVTIASTGPDSVIHTVLDGVTMDADLDVTAIDSGVRIANGLTLNGTAHLGNAGRLISDTTQTLGGDGQIVGAGTTGGGRVDIDGGTTLTIDPALTVRAGTGFDFSPFPSSGPDAVLVNQGLISADETTPGRQWSMTVNVVLVNQGTVEASNGATLRLPVVDNLDTVQALDTSFVEMTGTSSGTIRAEGPSGEVQIRDITLPGNTFELVSGGTVTLNGTLDNAGNTVFLDTSDGIFRVLGNNGEIVGGTVAGTAGSKVTIAATSGANTALLDGVELDTDLDLTTHDARLRVANGLTLNGTATVGSGSDLIAQGAQTWSGSGQLALDGGAVEIPGGTTLTIGSDLTVRGRGSFNIPSPFTGVLVNQGLISADEPTASAQWSLQSHVVDFVNQGTVEARNGATLRLASTDNLGTVHALDTSFVEMTGTNSGTVRADGPSGEVQLRDLATPHDGTISAGAGGVVTVEGDLVQSADANVDIELGGTSGSSFGQVLVNGSVSLAGGLNVSLVGGFVPTFSDTFTFLHNDGTDLVIDTFDTLTAGAGQFEINYDRGDGNDVELTAINAAPVFSEFSSNSPGCGGIPEGHELAVSGSFTDVNTSDSHSAIIDWGDGTAPSVGVITETGGSGTMSGSHTYADGGIYMITVTLSDAFDSVQETAPAVISGAGVTGGFLQVIGSDLADQVTVNLQDADTLKVHADFFETGNFKTFSSDAVTEILVVLCDGDDHGTVSAGIALPSTVDGGAGNDKLRGGSGPNVMLGGDGDDLLVGGSNRDMIVGGNGADRMIGKPEDDIMIGGVTLVETYHDAADFTGFAAREAQLDAIMAEWTSSRDYATRVANLTDGSGSSDAANGSVFLVADETVFDDDAKDIMTGSAGTDWFFANLEGEGVLDKITDLSDDEFSADLDFILEAT